MNQVTKNIFVKLYNEYYSLNIYTDHHHKKHTFKIRKLFILFFILTIAFAITASVLLTNLNKDLNSALNAKESNLKELNENATQQKEEIETLTNEFVSINEKIESISNLETEIRNLTGLEKDISTNLASIQVSRSSSVRTSFSAIKAVSNTNFETATDQMNNQLDDKLEEMNELIDEVEAQIEYLSSYPDAWPTYGRISSGYGYRYHPITGRRQFHAALDIANSRNTPIYASGKGKVIYSGYYGGYGYCVIIDHGYGYKTLYAHNNRLLVSRGDWVEKDDIIAKMGNTGTSTGYHVHFEVIQNGRKINPYNTLK